MEARFASKRRVLAISIIAAVFGLAGCASPQGADNSYDESSVGRVAEHDNFNAEEFIRRGFTDPVMTPRTGGWSNRTAWTYGLGTCRLTVSIKYGNAGRQAWNRITNAATMLAQDEYAHCKTTVEQSSTTHPHTLPDSLSGNKVQM